MSVTGISEPTKVGVPIADLLTGMNGAFGVASALLGRERTGRGMVVRTSLLAGVVGAHAFQGTRWTVGGEVPELSGAHHSSIAPYGLFATATESIQVACGSDSLWECLATEVGLSTQDERFATNSARVVNRTALTELLEAGLRQRSAEHWIAVLTLAGIPVGRVRSLPQVYEWDQTLSQGLLIAVQSDAFGELHLPGSALRFDDNDFSGGRLVNLAPPTLGQHNEVIRDWLAEELTS